MTMHIEGPWLSTSGKRKGKQKFRNAEAARKARELDASWEELQKKWAPKVKLTGTTNQLPKLAPPPGRETVRIPSRDTGGVATLAPAKVYTGSMVKGIATMHKSNAVPIFSNEEAVDIAKMRR
jgi:hypothetical protein